MVERTTHRTMKIKHNFGQLREQEPPICHLNEGKRLFDHNTCINKSEKRKELLCGYMQVTKAPLVPLQDNQNWCTRQDDYAVVSSMLMWIYRFIARSGFFWLAHMGRASLGLCVISSYIQVLFSSLKVLELFFNGIFGKNHK